MSLNVVGSDYCTSELVAAANQSTTTLLVSTPTEPFPTLTGGEYFYLTIVDQPSYDIDANPPAQREIVKVTAVATVSTGFSLTCVRGIKTTPQIWASGSIGEIRPCEQWFEDLKTIAGSDWLITDGVHTVNPVTQLLVNGINNATVTVTDLGGGAAQMEVDATGGSITVTDGSTTVTDATSIDFTSGATVTDLGGGVAGVAVSGGPSEVWWYGSGEDGSATLDGSASVGWATKSGSTYTMTRSVVLTNLTVNSGVTLVNDAYAIYCSGTLTNNGNINNNGYAAINGSSVTGPGSNCYGGGGNGATTNGTSAVNAIGGNAGAGGASTEHASRGTSTVTLPVESAGGIGCVGSFHSAITGRNFAGVVLIGGAGGFGGQGNSGAPNGQGSGGTGAGVVAIFAHAAAGNGTVTATGGVGGTSTSGGCGGGAGGGGGAIFIITGTATVLSLWTVTANGGAGGGSGGGGGSDGTGGAAGRIMVWIL